MRVLVACEESQVVCKAFRERGHEAYSCDLQVCSGGHPEWHIQGDIFEVLYNGWDLMVGHPPCDYISYVGTRHWNEPGRLLKRLAALDFFAKLWLAPIDRICLENPKGCASPTIAKYTQEIQPYYFGDHQMKTTWLWLKNLPQLQYRLEHNLFGESTSVGKPEPIYHLATNGKPIHFIEGIRGMNAMERKKARSKFWPGIAKAMAEQWG